LNNADAITTSVVPAADLALSQSAVPEPVWLGENLTYTLIISNQGPSAATGVILQDNLAGNTGLLSFTASQGTCTSQAGVVTCNIGNLQSGGQAVVALVYRPPTAGSLLNRASVRANELDPNLTNNQTALTQHAIAAAGLFASGGQITIPDAGPASPYPSTILVTGLTAAVQQVRVVLTNLSHAHPDDLDILLVGPNAQAVLWMSDAGG